MKDLVSIVIPAYNYAHFLPETFNNLRRQHYSNVEIIVIDDGSTDNTEKVCAKYAGEIRYIKKENGGLSAARNTGIDVARGEYISFLDADDLIHPRAISERISFLKENDSVGVSVCESRNFHKNVKYDFHINNWPLNYGDLSIHLHHFNIAPPHAFLMRTEVCKKIGYFDPEMKACEDYDYWYRIAAGGIKIARSPGLVYYRRHSNSMSANLTKQYHYDYVMHKKIFADLVSESIDSLDKYIAYISGACITCVRLQPIDIESSEKLLADLILASEKAVDVLNSNVNLSDETLFYLLDFRKYVFDSRLPLKLRNALSAIYASSSQRAHCNNVPLEAIIRAIGFGKTSLQIKRIVEKLLRS